MSGGSGLLDIERRAELAALERLRNFSDLLALVGNDPTRIVQGYDASGLAAFPGVYAEAYNMAEFGARTGNYMGGLRLGAIIYTDDDLDHSLQRQFHGAFKSWAQQIDLVSLLNGTLSARTFSSRIWFLAAGINIDGMGNQAYTVASTRLTNCVEAIQELSILCLPSRP